MAKRIDIMSDSHGRLSPELLAAIKGCDLLIHAGDITSEDNWDELCACVPLIQGVLGNNDWHFDYGPEVGRVNEFEFEGIRFCVAHYYEDLSLDRADIGICGHTHRASIEREGRHLVINPGSASYPRGGRGASIARLMVENGKVLSVEIVDL